jgi:hypothetical protein
MALFSSGAGWFAFLVLALHLAVLRSARYQYVAGLRTLPQLLVVILRASMPIVMSTMCH